MLTLDDRVCAVANLLSTTVDGETVVLDTERWVYVNLNVMASEILQRLEREMTLRDLCCGLTDTFDVASDEVEREVLAFAARLQDAGLIRLVA